MRNEEVKIIFVDIDNTILWHHKGHHDFDMKSIKALNKVQEKYGVKVVLATARPFDSAYGTGIFDLMKPDAVVGCNGTNVLVGKKVIYSDAFPKEIVHNVIDTCTELGIVVEVSTPFGRYFSMAPNEYVDEYFSVFHETLPMVKKNFDKEDVNALLVFAPEEFDNDIQAKLDKSIECVRFTRCGVDLRTHIISKADGVRATLKYFGLNENQAMSIGDSMFGDAPMFTVTKYSVAMGNGSDQLKEKAAYKTWHIKHHGVKHALKKLKLL